MNKTRGRQEFERAINRLAKAMEEREDIWMEIAKIHERDGANPLNQIDGLWRRALADGWSIVVNGHGKPIKDAETQFEVKPYNAIGVHGGIPYLYFGPPGTDGIALGHGSEDAFWKALSKTAYFERNINPLTP